MRKGLQNSENIQNNQYRIIAVDDEEGIVDSLSIFLKRSGYDFTGITDPLEAIEVVKKEHSLWQLFYFSISSFILRLTHFFIFFAFNFIIHLHA